MKLYLVRHPRPRIPPGICYGRLDAPLAEPASAAARRVRARLPAEFETWPLWTSPSRRCLELAAALHHAPRVDARLQEMDFGDWENHDWNSIDRAALDAWAARPLDFAPPGGECARAALARALAFVLELEQNRVHNAVCVTHAGIMRLLCAARQDMPQGWSTRAFPYETVLRWPEARVADECRKEENAPPPHAVQSGDGSSRNGLQTPSGRERTQHPLRAKQ
ncbi:MAG: histidine phosphatase family protein [Azoarcus sp.]|jgi:alpha-ribazole phosphatase|nr:histidine phosphatase family protein [Azoarcus sp.]